MAHRVSTGGCSVKHLSVPKAFAVSQLDSKSTFMGVFLLEKVSTVEGRTITYDCGPTASTQKEWAMHIPQSSVSPCATRQISFQTHWQRGGMFTVKSNCVFSAWVHPIKLWWITVVIHTVIWDWGSKMQCLNYPCFPWRRRAVDAGVKPDILWVVLEYIYILTRCDDVMHNQQQYTDISQVSVCLHDPPVW